MLKTVAEWLRTTIPMPRWWLLIAIVFIAAGAVKLADLVS